MPKLIPASVSSNKAKLISQVSAAQFSSVAELISTQPTKHRNSVLFIVFVCSLKKLGAPQLRPRNNSVLSSVYVLGKKKFIFTPDSR